MTKKCLTRLFAVACLLSTLAYSQTPNGCAVCQAREHNQGFTCGQCLPPGGAGPCCCIIETVGRYQSCFPGGCRQYIPGTGGVCYDQTGDQCGLQPCYKQGAPSESSSAKQATRTPVAGSTATAADLIKESPWLADTSFTEAVKAQSSDLGRLIDLLQQDLKLKNHLPSREGRTIAGKAYLRDDDFVTDISVTKVGDRWRLEITPETNDHAPNAVEIIGRDYRLIRHIHGTDTGDTVVYQGHY